jgi:hypothetical protein
MKYILIIITGLILISSGLFAQQKTPATVPDSLTLKQYQSDMALIQDNYKKLIEQGVLIEKEKLRLEGAYKYLLQIINQQQPIINQQPKKEKQQ